MDGYCERTGPEFWAEPLNAWTNVAFAVAAVLGGWLLARRPGRAPADLVVLVIALAAIAIGSFAFHTLATPAAALADTLPIAGFALLYAAVFVRRFLDVPWRRAWLAAPGFAATVIALAVLTGVLDLPVPAIYLAALLGMVVFAALLTARRDPAAGTFWLVASVFTVSLTLRQLDPVLCDALPIGTHFGWHLLNATVLGLLLAAAIDRQPLPPVAASR